MRTILFAMALMVLITVGAVAEEIVFGDCHLVIQTDDFTDEYSEVIGVQEESSFMPKNLGFYMDGEKYGMVYTHQSMVLEDRVKVKFRVNKGEVFEFACVNSEMTVFLFDADMTDKLVNALIEADNAGEEVSVAIMVVGESDSKIKFGMKGFAKAVEKTKLFKARFAEPASAEG